jgi:hypothetical protein
MAVPWRTLFIGLVIAALILSSWRTMLHSRHYATEPRWARWTWTIFYWLLAIGMGFFWLSLPA